MNDDDEISEVRESLRAEGADLAGVHLDRPADAVMARGQALRLRRRLLRGLSGVTAASAAMALVLGLALGGTGIRQVHVNEASWSVNTNQDGTVTVALREVSDPIRLQSALHEAGVPAAVGWNAKCSVPQFSYPSTSHLPYRPFPVVPRESSVRSGWSLWTIRPALIPAHTKIVVNLRSFLEGKPARRHLHALVWTIVPASTRLTCITSPLSRISPFRACRTSPHAIPSPAGTPSPSLTARPHATPSPDPTAMPHATPSPDPTPRPHPTPSPDSTPTPHATPSASPSPTCTPSPHPTSAKNPGAG